MTRVEKVQRILPQQTSVASLAYTNAESHLDRNNASIVACGRLRHYATFLGRMRALAQADAMRKVSKQKYLLEISN
jgi:hypothetical protein